MRAISPRIDASTSVKYLIPILILALWPLGFGDSYLFFIMILFFTWAIVALSWNILLGYFGIISLGQLAFFVIGGYSSGYLTLHTDASPFVGLVVGGGGAAIAALLIGLPVLRLRGIYVALITIAFQEVLRTTLLQPVLKPVTGAAEGLTNLPPFTLTGGSFGNFELYYVGLVLFLVTVFVLRRVVWSKLGLAFVALRESELRAVTLGVNPYSHKLFAFMIAAFFTGVAGAYYAHFQTTINYLFLTFEMLVMLLIMIVLGGMGRFYGPVVGAFIITLFLQYMRAYYTGIAAGQVRLIIMGVLILVVLVGFGSSGILVGFEVLARRIRRSRRKGPSSPAAGPLIPGVGAGPKPSLLREGLLGRYLRTHLEDVSDGGP